MNRELSMEFVRVTEAAAIASGRGVGRGDKNGIDQLAVDAMRRMFDTVNISGTVVIGEGEMDEAPMLYIGEHVGAGGPEVDIAVDPVEGTNLVAKGQNGAIAVIAIAPKGCLLHAPDMYMDKIAVGPRAKGCIDIDAPVSVNLERVAKAMNRKVSDLTVVALDRPRHRKIIEEVRASGARIRLISDGDVDPIINAGIEGTGIIAGERDLSEVLSSEEIAEAKAMINQVSVVSDGIIAGSVGTHGMHDVTEGGILGGVWEMCTISGLGASIDESAIPVSYITKKICDYLDLNYLRLISSGSMMIACAAEKKDEMLKKLEVAGIKATCIGTVESKEHGVKFTDGREIDPPSADEIYKAV